jgi:hypothetical protein
MELEMATNGGFVQFTQPVSTQDDYVTPEWLTTYEGWLAQEYTCETLQVHEELVARQVNCEVSEDITDKLTDSVPWKTTYARPNTQLMLI